jgi:uncharacterized protein with GYD domain
MPRYISLVSFTEEGYKHIKDTKKRAKAFADKAKKKGVIIQETFWTIGHYDIVHVFQAPDDSAAASVGFALGSMGNVRTETLRAFSGDEIEELLSNAYDMHLEEGSLR